MHQVQRQDDARTRRSQLDYAVLGLVIEQPSHGYEIAERFGATFGSLFPATQTRAIYKTLKRLAADGLVEAERGGPRVIYTATLAGLTAHARWVDAPHEEGDERAVLRRILAAPSEAALLRIIEQAEQRYLANLTVITGRMARDGRSVAEEIVIDHQRMRVEMVLNWLASARERLGAEV